jgi:transcriptional regulator with GAF, ATPase, and Fis domain
MNAGHSTEESIEQSLNRSTSAHHKARLNALSCLLERLLTAAESFRHEVERLTSAATENGNDMNLAVEMRRLETELIVNTLIRTGGNQLRAARLLGVKATTLNAKIKRYRIKLEVANEIVGASDSDKSN